MTDAVWPPVSGPGPVVPGVGAAAAEATRPVAVATAVNAAAAVVRPRIGSREILFGRWEERALLVL
ncbi:hypothetical protein GCM10009838_38250 [Catenulispora subtropica]|uniref:Uncharacterized protein n=1 Tax=Catenulispora subtropica TaxID=450798 RepID=A0ABN2RTP4_9ACTN